MNADKALAILGANLQPHIKLVRLYLLAKGIEEESVDAIHAGTGVAKATIRTALKYWIRHNKAIEDSAARPAQITVKPARQKRRRKLPLLQDEPSEGWVSRGELLMRELLDLVIDSTDYADGKFHSWLANPKTGKPMQLDRYYPSLKLAFEFQGLQHYQYTPQLHCSESDFQALVERDAAKKRILAEKGINLVEVRAEHLALEKIKRLLPTRTPKRSLKGRNADIARLGGMCKQYRGKVVSGDTYAAAD